MYTYHRWLQHYERNYNDGKVGYSSNTDDILDAMVCFFNQPRSVLKEVIGAWDGTSESIGETW